MRVGGFIKLHRKLKQWGWYSDANTVRVFLHLLLSTNYEPSDFHGTRIEAGQAVFGRREMAGILHLTEQQIRTALEHLQSTGEITIKGTNKFSVATIVKWEEYQHIEPENNQQNTKPITNHQPTKHHTNNQPITTSKNKEYLSPNGDTPTASGAKPEKKRNRMQKLIEEWDAPEAVKAELWKFISMRRDMKEPIAVVSVRELLQQLTELGWFKAAAALRHTVANGYKGLVIPKDIGSAAMGGLREI